MLRLLGPVQISGTPTRSDPPRQRLVLAALAVDAGRPVPVDVLVDRVWGADPPPNARRTLHSYIARTRRALAGAPARLDGGRGGYLLEVDPERVDLHRFRQLVGEARDATCAPARRVELLREAVALWRGPSLAGLDSEWAGRMRESWQHERLAATVAWADAELAAGDPLAALGPVLELAGEHPLVEPLTAVLMRLLARAGRTPEALQRYADARHRLADELGVDPGPELQAAHRAVLRGEPAVARDRVPAQLPLNLAAFAGRQRELAALDAVLAPATGPTVVAVVSGSAGVGKTTLAVHWAHRVADRFPDGQVFLNLRGFDAGQQPRDPADALRRLLDALGAGSDHLPDDTDALSTLFRSTVAGRRMLVILDNARTAAQVRPLLPGTPGCLVLVTSRSRLTGLLAGDGAVPIALDLPSAGEAHEVLARRLGPGRLAAEPAAATELIERCARLPLALAIVAARAATRPWQRLGDLAGELRESGAGLDAFTDAGDPDTDVRAVFSWSYQTLSVPGARLFRLIGLHPGPELSMAAAASLAGLPPQRVRSLLAELAGANLITEARSGRYVQHELLRAYAVDLAGAVDSAGARTAANLRLLDHLLHTGVAAARLVQPVRAPLTVDPASDGVTVEALADAERADGWFTAECAVLLAAVDHAFAYGFDGHAARLGSVIGDFLARRGRWHDQLPVQHAALSAAERTGDAGLRIRLRNQLGCTYAMLGRFDDARAHLDEALDLSIELGDRSAEAATHRTFAIVADARAQHAQALHHSSRALELWRTCADPRREALALSAVAWSHAMLGDYKAAVAHGEQTLALLRQWDQPAIEAGVLDTLGYAWHHLGRCDEAVPNLRKAIELNRRLGSPYTEAQSHLHLGDCHAANGDAAAARAEWERALALFDQLGHRDAALARQRLTDANI